MKCYSCAYSSPCFNEYDEYMGDICTNEESDSYNKFVYSDDLCDKFKER